MKSMEANSLLPKKKNSLSDMSKKEKKEKKKLKHQVKSRFYYIFWGTATAAVVLGQVYVGTGYREMVKGINALTYALARSV